MFLLPLPPTTNTVYVNRPGGRFLKPEAKAWKYDTGWTVKTNGTYNLSANYRIEVEMYVVRDRDIDGSLKLLLDAMTGIVYNDDRQVLELEVRKYKSKEPCLLLSIYQL